MNPYMKYMYLYSILILFQSAGFSQTWPKIYGIGYTDVYAFGGMCESYDKGYILLGQVQNGSYVPQIYSWIIKTDVNGNKLWTKSIASPDYQVKILGNDKTPDGGIILTGITNKIDPTSYDVLIMKINSCGEKQWCNIFSTPGNDDYGLKIRSIPGGYIALVKYFQDWMYKRIWLFKLDLNGGVIWQKLVSESDSILIGQEGLDLLVTTNGDYLVTGDGYDGTPGHLYTLRPLILKTDSNGNDLWTLSFGHSFDFIGSMTYYPNENANGNYFMAARHNLDSLPYSGMAPCFLKVSSTGQPMYYRDLISGSGLGSALTLNLKDNDTLFIYAEWTINNIDTVAILKCDTLGHITKKKVIFNQYCGNIMSSLFTFDEKYLASGSFIPGSAPSKLYLYKFNTNLEFDSVYTMPRTYDSLCPHPIVSDTISLAGCGVITEIDDPLNHPEKSRMLIYPNPANDRVFIQFPKYLQRDATIGQISTTTIYHQWTSTLFEIYNLNGSRVYSSTIPKSIEKIEIDISNWSQGLYFVRLLFGNNEVASEKFLIVR